MSGSEDEPYSTIFTSLKHPIRRKMLRILSEKPRSFSEMLEAFKVSSSHLTYHLENLGELVSKTDDGKYKLSAFGEAAVATMSRVEETPKATETKRLSSLPKKWKSLLVALLIGLVILAGVSFIQYQSLNHMSREYDQLEKLVDLVKDGASFQTEYDLSYANMIQFILNDSTVTFVVVTNVNVLGPSYCAIYSLHDDCTLDLFLSTHLLSEGSYVPLAVQKGNVFDLGTDETLPVVWSLNASETGTRMYSVPLASEGWYTVSLVGPITNEIVILPFQEANCTASLIMMHEGTASPFVVMARPLL